MKNNHDVVRILQHLFIVTCSDPIKCIFLNHSFMPLYSKSFREVLTVNNDEAESSEESAEDITAAATAARPYICSLFVFVSNKLF